jgi:chloramphenicol 3-O-phosphotransferase
MSLVEAFDCEFITLVDAARMGRGLALIAVFGKKQLEDVDRRLLRRGQEDPGMAAAGIADKAVRIVAVMR